LHISELHNWLRKLSHTHALYELSNLFIIPICREICAYWILNSQLYICIFLNCHLTIVSVIYTCVLKLFLEKLFSYKFFLCFQLLVWNVRTDLFLSPETCASVNLWFGSMPSGQVCTMSGGKPFVFFAICTALHFYLIVVMLCVSLGDFSEDFGILCTSLLILWYSLCLPL